MTEKQFLTLKLSKVCSYEAYQWLERIVNQLQAGQRYPLPVKEYFYSQTGHRQYLSKFMESVITKIINKCKPEWEALKPEDKGYLIETSKGKKYIPNKSTTPGEPDIKIIERDDRFKIPIMYFEVKVGRDRLSDEQIDYHAYAKARNIQVYVVRTVCDVLEILYNLKIIEK